MIEYFEKFFNVSDFPARWNCGRWSDFLGWLHILSDLATWSAYFAIPLILIYFARKRSDFPFTRLFWLFAGFILACGTVHLVEAVIFWYPIYRISGMIKLITAIVSWCTVIALVRIIPNVIHLPSLAMTNELLTKEVEQRKETERELRAAKGRYEALLSDIRSVVWTADQAGQFSTPQVSWQRYTGQKWDTHRENGWMNAIHEQDRLSFHESWKVALANQCKYEFLGRLWNQQSCSYRSIIAEAVPVLAEDGEVIEWVGTINDIEDRQQAEVNLASARTELARQKRELELIYESAPVGMSLISRDRRYLRINKRLAEINGFSQEEHIGQKVESILEDLHNKLEPIYKHVFDTGIPMPDVEVVGRTKASENERTWLASFYPLESNSGTQEVSAVSAIVQDITDRKVQEERLRDSEKAALASSKSKSEFLANMSHEIRTPMSAILGYADILQEHLDDPDNRSCVAIIKKNGQYLLELINDILDLSRIEANKLELDLSPCNVVGLVSDLNSLMHVRASEKKLNLEAKFESEIPETILTDQIRLRQILINLLGNAIKFTDQGSVTLAVRYSNAQMEFSVSDTGIGISEEQQSRLFKPFSQGDPSVTRQYGGSGLGLAISHRLIEALGGNLRAVSKLGQGSTFHLTIPVLMSDDINMIQPHLDELVEDKRNLELHVKTLHCRILVVDDRREVRHISQHFLEKAGATVLTAENGEQGIIMALASLDDGRPFDIIVMDMQMPIVDGLQATAKLRTAGIKWPIIALTADAMKGDREKCIRGGCDDYLTKPINPDTLIGMIYYYTEELGFAELQQLRLERARKATPE